ncbi:hypothetical protein D3C83_150790 [compost metagenome]
MHTQTTGRHFDLTHAHGYLPGKHEEDVGAAVPLGEKTLAGSVFPELRPPGDLVGDVGISVHDELTA